MTTYEVLLLLNARSNVGAFSVFNRALGDLRSGFSNLSTSMKSTSLVAQEYATKLATATSLEQDAVDAKKLLALNTTWTATEVQALTAQIEAHTVALREAERAQAALSTNMRGTGAALGSLAPVAATGATMAAVAVGAIGVKSIQMGMQFQQTVANIVAQTIQNPGQIMPLMQMVLRVAGTNQMFNPTQIAAGLFPILSSATAFKTPQQMQSALQTITLQAQSSGPDSMEQIAQADIGVMNAFGMTAKNFNDVANIITKGVSIAHTHTSQFATGEATFSQAAYQGGASLADVTGAFAYLTKLNPRVRFDAQDMNSMIMAITGKQQAGQQRAAKELGISDMFTQGAFGKAGGFAQWIQQIQNITSGPLRQQLLQVLFPNKTELTGIRMLTGQNFAGAQAAMTTVRTGHQQAVAEDAASALSTQQAALKIAMGHLNTDMTNMGTTLMVAVIPRLTSFATNLSAMIVSLQKPFGDFGGWLEQSSKTAGTSDLWQNMSKLGQWIDTQAAHAGFTPMITPTTPTTAPERSRPLARPGTTPATPPTPPRPPAPVIHQGKTTPILGGLGDAMQWAWHQVTHFSPPHVGGPLAIDRAGPTMEQQVRAEAQARSRAASMVGTGLGAPQALARAETDRANARQQQAIQERMTSMFLGGPGTLVDLLGTDGPLVAPLTNLAATLTQFTTSSIANVRTTRDQAAIAAAGTAGRGGTRRMIQGTVLERPVGVQYYDRYSLFNEARAAYGNSAVQLAAGGSTAQDTAQRTIAALQRQVQQQDKVIQQNDEQIRILSAAVSALDQGNTINKSTQIALGRIMPGFGAQPATTSNPPRRTGRTLSMGV